MIRALRNVPDWLKIGALATCVRLLSLGAESLWYDEAFTAWLVGRLSWDQMWRAILGDVHPPLWYVIERAAVRILGSSELALRLPAAAFGVASVILVWLIARELRFGRAAALMAGILAALLPAALYYSQDARMYPMLATFVLLSLYGLQRQNWYIFVIGGIGALYSQNLALVYIVALGGTACVQNRQRPALPMLALACVALAWLPWASTALLQQAGSVADGYWLQPLTTTDVFLPLVGMTMGWRLHGAIQLQVYGASIAATVMGLISARQWILTRNGQLVTACLVGAPALLALASWLWRPVYLPRVLLPSAMLIPLLWAWLLCHLSAPNRRAVGAILIPALAAGVIAHYFPVAPREDLRGRAAIITKAARPGDVAYFTALHTAITLSYYLPDLPAFVRPHATDLDQTLTDETRAAMGFQELAFGDLPARWGGAWIIVYLSPRSAQDERAEVDRIVEAYHPQIAARWEQPFGALTVYYVRFM